MLELRRKTHNMCPFGVWPGRLGHAKARTDHERMPWTLVPGGLLAAGDLDGVGLAEVGAEFQRA